jgi:5-methylcytosine-specific restriction endonuclease McrA
MKITIKENFELFPEQSLHDLVNKWEAFKKETEKWEKECQTIKESCEKFNDNLMKKILPEEEMLNRDWNYEVDKIKKEVDSIWEIIKNKFKERDEWEKKSYQERNVLIFFNSSNKNHAIYQYQSIESNIRSLYDRLLKLLRALLYYKGGYKCLIEDYENVRNMDIIVRFKHINDMSRFLVNREEKLSEVLPKIDCKDTKAGKPGPRHYVGFYAKSPCYAVPECQYQKSQLRTQLKKIILPNRPDSVVELQKGSITEKFNFLSEYFNINIVRNVLESKIEKRTKYELVKGLAAAHQNETRSLADKIKKDLQSQTRILNYCPYCGQPFGEIVPANSPQLSLFEQMEGNENKYINAHADHIYPVSKGGLSTRKNMVYICATCNMKKSDKTLREFIKENNLDRDKIEKNLELLKKSF